MIARSSGPSREALAHRFFDVLTQLSLALPRNRRRGAGQLKETEFYTLALLQQHHTLSVGEIHRMLHILPAQMSRVLRALEMRQPPLITCQINAGDKRKVDVQLTPAGEEALTLYETRRVDVLSTLLNKINEEDLQHLAHVLDTIEEASQGPPTSRGTSALPG